MFFRKFKALDHAALSMDECIITELEYCNPLSEYNSLTFETTLHISYINLSTLVANRSILIHVLL